LSALDSICTQMSVGRGAARAAGAIEASALDDRGARPRPGA
jgi:hypothetical protein